MNETYTPKKDIKDELIQRQNVQHAKVVISGPRVRLVETAPLDGFIHGLEGRKKTKYENKIRPTAGEAENRFESSLSRSRSKVAEHIWNNFVDGSAFLTLTYKDEKMNVHKYDESLKHFDIFIKKLRKKYPSIKYLAVTEKQEMRAAKYNLKEGPLHFHILVDKRNINEKNINKMWPHGLVFKKKTYGKPQKLVNYLTKYITKETLVKAGRKSYLRSRNLTKSKVITEINEAYKYMLNMFKKNTHELMYETSFRSFIGRIFVQDYYLPDKHLHFDEDSG